MDQALLKLLEACNINICIYKLNIDSQVHYKWLLFVHNERHWGLFEFLLNVLISDVHLFKVTDLVGDIKYWWF